MIKKKLSLLGIPSDLGANVVGARYAPNRIRKFLLPALRKLKVDYVDFGNVPVPSRHTKGQLTKKHLSSIATTCLNLSKHKDCFSDKYFPVVLGGDHSITICYINEIAKGNKIGIIYFDAHGDYNTPGTTPSGNIHGMVLSELATEAKMLTPGRVVNPKNIVMISIRDLDREEKRLLRKSRIKVFPSKKVKRLGVEKVMKRAVKIASNGTKGFHLSVDLDAVDPKYAPGVSTPAEGGLSKKEILAAMKLVPSSKVISADFVEVNPRRDVNDKTSKLVVQMIKNLVS